MSQHDTFLSKNAKGSIVETSRQDRTMPYRYYRYISNRIEIAQIAFKSDSMISARLTLRRKSSIALIVIRLYPPPGYAKLKPVGVPSTQLILFT